MENKTNSQNTTEPRNCRVFDVIMRFIKTSKLYLKVAILGHKQIEGYLFREIGNSPIVGCNHYQGYEIINSQTNRVLFRKVKDWGYISSRGGSFKTDEYTTVRRFFPKNAL